MKKYFLSLFLALALMLSAFSVSAVESKDVNILVIGDSISTGYGLASASTEGFAAIFKSQGGFSVNNKAVDGNTANGILAQFDTNAITDTDIQAADIVTITCGGNDLMALLYNRIAEVWNERNPNAQITASDVPLEMINSKSSKRMGLMSIAISLLNNESDLYYIDDPEFTSAVSQYIENLNSIVEYINSKNGSAEIIVATQYNPYAEFSNATFGGFINLGPICVGIEAGVKGLNDAIVANSESGVYYVADVKTAFDIYSGGGDLYNASPNSASFNVDFHPTAEGHKVIAETFLKIIEEINASKEMVESDSSASDDTSDVDTSKTGDNGGVWIWFAVLAVGIGVVLIVVFIKRRKTCE